MKLTEKDLMIGDWVALPFDLLKDSCQPFKARLNLKNIVAIYDGKLVAEPIPLTEEILEANGWACDDINYSWYLDKFPDLYIHEDGFLNYYDGIEVRFNFVHELQQALRICGLTELADNFKVV